VLTCHLFITIDERSRKTDVLDYHFKRYRVREHLIPRMASDPGEHAYSITWTVSMRAMPGTVRPCACAE
jgi:hypothetical protein